MSRPLREVVPEKTSQDQPVNLVMVYLCQCGTKWTGALKPAWECKCGRQLVKRNGIVYASSELPSRRVFIVSA